CGQSAVALLPEGWVGRGRSSSHVEPRRDQDRCGKSTNFCGSRAGLSSPHCVWWLSVGFDEGRQLLSLFAGDFTSETYRRSWTRIRNTANVGRPRGLL